MTNRTITAVVMAVGLVAASAGTAGAGSGGGGLPGAGGDLFQCYVVNGSLKSGDTIDMNDKFTHPTNVVVGAPAILCVPAGATTVTGNFSAFQPGEADPDSILCYAPQVSNTIPAGVSITVRDPLTPGAVQTVRVSATKYVCVQAITSGCVGCPGPP